MFGSMLIVTVAHESVKIDTIENPAAQPLSLPLSRAARRLVRTEESRPRARGRLGWEGRVITSESTTVQQASRRLIESVASVIVGKEDVIELAVTALLCRGHLLFEDVPGSGKTTLAKALAASLGCTFNRVQFTRDLMPADITGTNVLVESADGRRGFRFEPGPIFAHLVLADEINRATPKTQSALLEAMQERQVSVGREAHALDRPFFVLATQNPIEMEGTYPLPEAQIDRFMFKLVVDYPSGDELGEIIARTTGAQVPGVAKVATGDDLIAMGEFARRVAIAPHVEAYVVTLVKATHPSDARAHAMTRQFVRYGASPRAAQALVLAGKVYAMLDGRYNVGFDDIRRAVKPAMRHRILLNFEAEAQGVTSEGVLDQILMTTRPDGG